MSGDPYRILGVSPSNTEDEIKSAYRKLAKKYHPDVNGGSPAAEQKMKEINEAYQEIIRAKRNGTTAGARQSGGTAGSNQGYGGYGGYGGGYGGYSGYGRSAYGGDVQFTAVRNYIRFGRYEEAASALRSIQNHNAEWHYLNAVVNLYTGNRVAAMDYARKAADMDPNNLEYQTLLARIQGNSEAYEERQSGGFGGPFQVCGNPVMGICLANLLCMCLCNICGSGCGGCGGYSGYGGYGNYYGGYPFR